MYYDDEPTTRYPSAEIQKHTKKLKTKELRKS